MTLHAGIWTAPAPTALELLAPARDADAGIAAMITALMRFISAVRLLALGQRQAIHSTTLPD